MASSRRTSPAQINRQQEWAQETNEEAITSDIRAQSNEENTDEREGGRRRELSNITQRHLERVINTMIPSSTSSSMNPVDSAPVNSLVSQSSKRRIEEGEPRQVPTEKRKQVIVNNYYITDRKEGWKQLEKGEIPPNILEDRRQRNSSEISPEKSLLEADREVKNVDHDRRNTTQTKADPKGFYGEEAEVQNMSPPTIYNPNYPPPNRYSGNQETAAMLDCIRQLQLTVQHHVLTNSKQAEYHMSQNADLFTEMAKGQKRRDLDPAAMAIPTFTGQELEKCLDWINRIRNICNQAGRPLRQEFMNKSEPVVQNFIGTMGDTWTEEEVIEEIVKYFSDIPTPAHAITKLRALIHGE